VTDKVLADYTTAPIDEPLRATLGLLKKMTLDHEALTAADMKAVLDKGVSPAKLRDALYVAFLFNVYDRLADTLGWPLLGEKGYQAAGKRLFKSGYR
jgi:alkylhydroperoxidase family enzyme